MAATDVTLSDLARPVEEVARGLAAWTRGDPDEAAQLTLKASGRDLHSRTYTLWAWTGVTARGEQAWALPVSSAVAADFRPKGPAVVLARCVEAAGLTGADLDRLRVEEWAGTACIVVPGADPALAREAMAEAHPSPNRVDVGRLPAGVTLGGPAVALPPLPAGREGDLMTLARELGVHPLRVVVTLVQHGQPVDLKSYPAELARSLREWGCSGDPAPPDDEDAPSLEISDDPCPRRRHARVVLQRMLRMGKVGTGYHTDIANFARGAAAHDRRQALEVGEALLRAGLLGEKPSVGQRHIYLNVKALPEIHALIERGETSDPGLAALWTAPAPGDAVSPPAER
ncbi:MAG: hypothetical protein AB7V42_00225 [Thermoleophilia bacterium]